MRLIEWVDAVKATGGVPDSGPDTLGALRSASTLCWDEIDRQGYSRNETVQLGVKWVAAFMVSCARHGATDFRSILVPSDWQQAVLKREAARNDGVIAQILEEAASTPPRVFSSAVFPTGLHWINNPSGRGTTLGR